VTETHRLSRLVSVLLAMAAAFLLQVTLLPHLAWQGVAPDLVLLVVVGAALATDVRFATLLGFAAGLLLDIAPPGDHTAGRWALALLVVGYVVGRLGHDHAAGGRPTLPVVLAASAGGSFLGLSVFALSGLALGEVDGVGTALGVVGPAVLVDAVAGLLVVPATAWWLARGAAPGRAPITPSPQRPTRPVVR
jgi:rod shape-determining protein MreD